MQIRKSNNSSVSVGKQHSLQMISLISRTVLWSKRRNRSACITRHLSKNSHLPDL